MLSIGVELESQEPTLYSLIFRLAAASSLLKPSLGRSGPVVLAFAGAFRPKTSSSSLFLFSSGVSSQVESGPPFVALVAPDLALLPVLNLRLRSLVGSTRDVQSEFVGGTIIQESRCTGGADDVDTEDTDVEGGAGADEPDCE